MSESFAVGPARAVGPAPARPHADPAPLPSAARPARDPRRTLQLALATAWLLDGILQFQPSMFTTAFPRMLAGASAGNPAAVASPVHWSAALITHHLAVLNAVFATAQLAIGLGVAWRPTVRLALAGSVLWAAAVWWLGEGLGGVLSGTAAPVTGAPGAVILYALLAVLLWPPSADRPARFAAGRAVGPGIARVLWLALWASLAFLALQPAARAPRAVSGVFADMAAGQPGWLAWLDLRVAGLLAGQGLLVAVLFAAACAVVAAGPWLPDRATRAARAAIVLAVAVAAFIWLAEGLGGLITGSGTDPNSGPLLALLAAAFWPAPARAPGPVAEGA
jgi:hypothetical protein